jgi:NADH dehydrogenase FAD-containing subunit
MNVKSMKKTKIVITGGGFAGLYAAKYFDKHLARRGDVEVTLIARENFILFTPMLHEVAAGDLAPVDIVNPLRRILRHVNVIEADAQDVDLTARKVRCVHGLGRAELEFEYYRTVGMLASIGHHTGVASVFGFKFSGFIAWWMWRTIYLAKLPRLVKKLRVVMTWTLDLVFGRDIEQMITLRDIDQLTERWTRIRARRETAVSQHREA